MFKKKKNEAAEAEMTVEGKSPLDEWSDSSQDD